MITLVVLCPHCQSDRLVRNGRAADGTRHLCRASGDRSTQNPRPNGYTPEQRETILRASQERSSLRGLSRTFGVTRQAVARWVKEEQPASAR